MQVSAEKRLTDYMRQQQRQYIAIQPEVCRS